MEGSTGLDTEYESGTNGGIVGTVSYGTTRNETDPRYAAIEDWQPGVSNLTVRLYNPVLCGTHAGSPCDASGRFELETVAGAFKKESGGPLQSYTTEVWQRPRGCVAHNVDGIPLAHGTDENVLPVGSCFARSRVLFN